MLEAAFWGFVGGGSLIIGALLGLYLNVSHRTIGLVMGFGAGVLISAVAFELTLEAYEAAGGLSAAAGLVAGSAVFSRVTGSSTAAAATVARARCTAGCRTRVAFTTLRPPRTPVP